MNSSNQAEQLYIEYRRNLESVRQQFSIPTFEEAEDLLLARIAMEVRFLAPPSEVVLNIVESPKSPDPVLISPLVVAPGTESNIIVGEGTTATQ